MSSRLKLAGICFAAAFVLAACGGGGGSPLDSARSDLQQVRDQLAEAETQRDAAVTRYMLAEAAQMLDDTPADDTAAQAQLRAALARAMAAEGTQMLPSDPADDTAAQAQLRAALARAMAAEGTQMLPSDPADDTAAQAQLRAALARAMAAEGTQMLPSDPADDTAAQAQLRAALARAMAAEGTQMLPSDPADDTAAQAQLRAALARAMAAEGTQMLPDDPADDTAAQAQLRTALARAAAAEGMQDIAAIRAKAPADRTAAEQQLLDAVDAHSMANSVSGLFQTAATTYNAGAAAVRNATQAVADAQKYAGMLTASSVNGESAKAIENAQKVLDARDDANAAVIAAEQAVKDAETAKMTAMGLDDGATKDALIAALNAAIQDAESKVTSAKMARDMKADGAGETDPTLLTTAVRTVTGTDAANPMDPADAGDAVAATVLTALQATITPATTVPSPTPMGAELMSDAMAIMAMTWAQIVGEANVMMRRLGTGNANIPVASIAGMKASDVDKTDTAVLVATGTFADAMTYGTATVVGTPGTEYKGIPGTVWCLGGTDGCSVNADGTLSSGWYFTPTNAMEYYVESSTTAGSYIVANLYARYGYWLAFDGTSGDATGVTPYSALGNTATNTANLDTDVAPGSTDTSATYTGKAVGVSVHEVTDTHDNRLSISSGKFTADVTLNAKWAATARLGGTVSNFQGNAVDPRWSVTLTETDIANDDSTVTVAAGVAQGDAGQTPGAWTAAGYGPPQTPAQDGNDAVDHRPTGFHGTFNANFTDGAVAGGYAVRN